MRTQRIAALCCGLLVCGTFVMAATGAAGLIPPSDPDYTDCGVLRLHIIANSDSPRDQAAKLAVRDAVLPLLQAADSEETAEETVKIGAKDILSAARAALAANGCSQSVRLFLGDFPFPRREYAGVVYPAGTYRALRIVLGNGAGQNWWCVLFPPLCLTTFSEETDEPDRGIVVESILLNWLRSGRRRT